MVKEHQDVTMVSGDTLDIQITVTDQDGTAVNLTDHTINWALCTNQNTTPPLVVKSTGGYGVTITNAVGGVFKVALVPTDTAAFSGIYYHEAVITQPTGEKYTVTTGYMTIESDVIV